MKVKILKCERTDQERLDYYAYTVRVYDGYAQGTHRIAVTRADVLGNQLEAIIHKELESIAATNQKKELENNKVQSIVGRIFHW